MLPLWRCGGCCPHAGRGPCGRPCPPVPTRSRQNIYPAIAADVTRSRAPPPVAVVPPPNGACLGIMAMMQGLRSLSLAPPPAYTLSPASRATTTPHGPIATFENTTQNAAQALWIADGHKGRTLPHAEKQVAWRRWHGSLALGRDCGLVDEAAGAVVEGHRPSLQCRAMKSRLWVSVPASRPRPLSLDVLWM